ncbi:MAG: putative porin, partial [Candidatus Cryptobacteroides sp.]
MRKRTGKIWIPALLIGMAAIQSFGIDTGRAIHMKQLRDSLEVFSDSVVLTDSIIGSDSVQTAVRDSVLAWDSIGIAISDSVMLADSIAINVSDSIKKEPIIPPDSLRETDPLKFKYYIAIKDSLTRAHTRDSLLEAGDSIELAILDSLYISDSIMVAKENFEKWYASLSKKERKAYDYKQKLPLLLHRSDSIMRRKDSIKARKDSIIAATPRILETYAIPDSLKYKRIVTWTRERKFSDYRFSEIDTTYNYHFQELPIYKNDVNAVHLGTSGSAAATYNFFKREEEENVLFYTPYRIWTYTPENVPMYNTKTPYTELAYWGTLFSSKEVEEMNLKFLTTQNILPEWNVTLEFDKFGAKGMLKNEATDNRTFTFNTNYTGKKYLLNAGYIYNKVKRTENGGMVDNFWVRDTTVDAREINVHLSEAESVTKKHTVFLDQSYRIPFDFIMKIGQRKKEKALQDSLAKAEALAAAVRDSLTARRDSLLAAGDSLAAAKVIPLQELTGDSDDDMEEAKEEPADTIVKDVTTAFIG